MNTIFSLRPEATRTNIALYHDYLCPWCWVGFFQAKKLAQETGVTFHWIGASLYPPELDAPASNPGPRPIEAVDLSVPKSRFELFCESENLFLPSPRPGFVRTHNALLAAEWAKESGEGFDALNEEIYRAHWERCENIEDISVLASLAKKLGLDGDSLAESVRQKRHDERIVRFDDGAYNIGIRHVPTFVFGGEELLAEAHYIELKLATERFLMNQERLEEVRQQQEDTISSLQEADDLHLRQITAWLERLDAWMRELEQRHTTLLMSVEHNQREQSLHLNDLDQRNISLIESLLRTMRGQLESIKAEQVDRGRLGPENP